MKNTNKKGIAYLSNFKNYTVFKYGDFIVRFKAPYSLEYYKKVKEWDNGYLVVDTKYKHNSDLIEEYIDVSSILNDLNLDTNSILKPIKEVEVKYD